MSDPAPWRRLDPRMLLIHPVQTFIKFLPGLLAIAIGGAANGLGPWGLLGIGLPIGVGILTYLTTSYRITDDLVELRRGLLQRRTTTARLDRVRTVDVTATVWHRLLGLSCVVIGTGSGGVSEDERLELDGLPSDDARMLRDDLLTQRLAEPTAAPSPAPAPSAPPAPPREIVRFRPAWLRYAIFTPTGPVAAAALVGALAQSAESLDLRFTLDDPDLPALTGLLVSIGVAVLALLTLVLVVVGYLVAYGNFRLARSPGAWQIRRGLVTTRETSLDVDRVAGVSIAEPALMRAARGAQLRAIVTGLTATSEGNATLVPPAPRSEVDRAADAVLGTTAPVHGDLLAHGDAAARRRYLRALVGFSPAVAAPIVAVLAGAPGWLLALSPVLLASALLIARDRVRGLGHAWIDGHVVMRSGSLARRRTALAGAHVIGWTERATWFQRRQGLVGLTATTAGGAGHTTVADVPVAAAYTLAEQATPGLLAQFRGPS